MERPAPSRTQWSDLCRNLLRSAHPRPSRIHRRHWNHTIRQAHDRGVAAVWSQVILNNLLGRNRVVPRECGRRSLRNCRVDIRDRDGDRVVAVQVNLEGAKLLRKISQRTSLHLPETMFRSFRGWRQKSFYRVEVTMAGNPHQQIRRALQRGYKFLQRDSIALHRMWILRRLPPFQL